MWALEGNCRMSDVEAEAERVRTEAEVEAEAWVAEQALFELEDKRSAQVVGGIESDGVRWEQEQEDQVPVLRPDYAHLCSPSTAIVDLAGVLPYTNGHQSSSLRIFPQ